MTVTILDPADRPIPQNQLSNLALWNDTLSHICATVIARATHESSPAQAS